MEAVHIVGLKDVLSPHSEDICTWNVHLHRDADRNTVVNVRKYIH